MIVGLTGGIGSGKSTVAKMFAVLGLPVYDTDARAKETYYKPEVKEKIIALLGEGAYYPDGKINPGSISKIVFNDSSLLQKLNAIIHPAVDSDFREFVEANKNHKLIVKESALLFETGVYK